MSKQSRPIRTVIMRGSTSRGLFIRSHDLPDDPDERDRVIMALFGTPDRRQIDGLGGADLLTSKLAIIAPSHRDDADVEYTFVQVGLENPTLDYNGNCGNISAAVGPYAIEEGLVAAVTPTTVVRIYNTNTRKILTAEVPVTPDGSPAVDGDCEIAGVPGRGARILLDYSATVGSVSGCFFPTGNHIDHIDHVPGHGRIPVTLTDLANPVVYVRASDLGMTGIEQPHHFDLRTACNTTLEYLRCRAAEMFGLTNNWRTATATNSTFPLLVVVSAPLSFPVYGVEGGRVDESEVDIVVRMFAMQQMHKAYAGTGTANLGATCLVPGTVIQDVLRPGVVNVVRFGHPTGVSRVEAAVSRSEDGTWMPTRAIYERTARRIMDGTAYVRESQLHNPR